MHISHRKQQFLVTIIRPTRLREFLSPSCIKKDEEHLRSHEKYRGSARLRLYQYLVEEKKLNPWLTRDENRDCCIGYATIKELSNRSSAVMDLMVEFQVNHLPIKCVILQCRLHVNFLHSSTNPHPTSLFLREAIVHSGNVST